MKKSMASISGSVPFFQTIGNHDHLNETDNNVTTTYWKSIENFQKYFGPQNYSFNRGDVHIISMDNVLHGEQPDQGEDQEFAAGFYDWQFEWLKQDLSYVPKTRWSFSAAMSRSGADLPTTIRTSATVRRFWSCWPDTPKPI